ncbi:MAG TPA: UrcA family protein, partial [Sphingomonadaceae bacterium]|nr:UrcA family protein [Sphingomonadaceae bacterium]
IFVAQPAFAEAAVVSYKDLDLTTEQGQKELDRRIDGAAREVCGMNEERTGTRIVSSDARKCYKEARKQLENRLAALTVNKTAGS